MALATQCPHCGTTFRVAADQLKLRGGIVRCGKCSEVFDGNATLIDLDAAPAATPAPSPSEAFDAQIEAIEEAAAAQGEETPIYTLDFDATFDPLGILPKPEAEEAPAADEETFDLDFEVEPSPAETPEAPIELDFDVDTVTPAEAGAPAPEQTDEQAARGPRLRGDDELAAHAAAYEPQFTVTPAEAGAPAPEQTDEQAARGPRLRGDDGQMPQEPQFYLEPDEAQEAELVPTAMSVQPEPAAVEPEPEPEEPGFVTREKRKEKTTRVLRVLMAIGSLLLVAALLVQGLTTFRNVLAARFPQLKPALAAGCEVLSCKVGLPAQADALAVETGELQTLGGDAFAFSTMLRNQSALTQAWPHIELALTDANDKPVLRRVIAPSEYLPAGLDPARGFAARSEQPVKLYFTLKDVKASGYHIAVFYP